MAVRLDTKPDGWGSPKIGAFPATGRATVPTEPASRRLTRPSGDSIVPGTPASWEKTAENSRDAKITAASSPWMTSHPQEQPKNAGKTGRCAQPLSRNFWPPT